MTHLSAAHRVAAGLHAEPALAASFAATQAAWRFFANPAITLPLLAGPLLEAAGEAMADCCGRHVLVPVDWCNIHLARHDAKPDRIELAHSRDLGYELLTALAVSDRDGSPIAPLCLEMRAADGLHSTRFVKPQKAASSLDGVEPVLRHASDAVAATGRTAVFLIDREADSAKHYRQWDLAGHRFVVRAKGAPCLVHDGVSQPLEATADALRPLMLRTRIVEYHGKPAIQFVAETTVVLARPARSHRVDPRSGKARHKNQAGVPLTLRLIVSEVRDDQDNVLSRWLILSNLPAAGPDAVDAATIALWYYWRWRIESYHKLLKGAGQQLECWQQESADAIARRLLVAAMACVVVWKLARDPRPEAAELRSTLVGLGGRQMKRGKTARGFTEPALLAGLEFLVRMLQVLQQHDVAQLRQLVDAVLPGLIPPAITALAKGRKDV